MVNYTRERGRGAYKKRESREEKKRTLVTVYFPCNKSEECAYATAATSLLVYIATKHSEKEREEISHTTRQ